MDYLMIEVRNKELYKLQFDQFSRQYNVFQIVRSVYKTKKLRLLDVGGHLGKTHEFFQDDEVIVSDLYDLKQKNYVKASGLDLPFSDGEFDVVLSFDVFEHIAAKDRKKFVSELCRVSKDLVIIAAPFNTQLVATTEKQVNELYKKLYKKDQVWLAEHIDNGLPEMDLLISHAETNKLDYRFYASNNLHLWKMIMSFHFLCGDSRLPQLSEDLDQFYNENMNSLGDTLEPTYRKICVLSKKDLGSELPDFSSKFDEKIYNEFIDKTFTSLAELLKDKRLSIEELLNKKDLSYQNELGTQAAEIKQLKHELSDIKNSRAWKLASKLSKAKNRISK